MVKGRMPFLWDLAQVSRASGLNTRNEKAVKGITFY
jgi:hypothetical protein